jgi:hypothetical protein
MRALLPFMLIVPLACAPGPVADPAPDAGSPVADPPDAGDSSPKEVCSAPSAPECEDQAILELNLQESVAPGVVESTTSSGEFHALVDATAGGFGANPPHAYVYARFTDSGLEKVDIGDYESLESMEWDIALQRYRVRINGGDSGPSCVSATRASPALEWDDVSSVPAGANFRTDEYLTPKVVSPDGSVSGCALVPDSSNPIPGAYASALGGFFSYTSEGACVRMTGNIYLIRLRSGRTLKLRFTHYYDDGPQQKCDLGLPFTPSGSGKIQFQWKFLE